MEEIIGLKFKEIRKNKDYSQQFMAEGIMTQSTYSKFELGKNEISYSSYTKLLEKLEMSHEEFEYINNDYRYNKHARLINEFFNLSYNDPEQLNEVVIAIKKFLEEEDNILIQDILIICEALKTLNEKNNIELARKEVEPVWKRLAKRNYWYLLEIKVLNTILFLFPAPAAVEMTKKALANLKKYDTFKDADKLVGILKLNLSLLLIDEKEYKEALALVEQTIKISKQHSMYKQLAAAHVRRGICMSWLGEKEADKEIEKGIIMLEFLEDYGLKDVLIRETRRYSKLDK